MSALLLAKGKKGKGKDMFNMKHIDGAFIEECRRSFKRVYPEFRPRFFGASQDKAYLLAEVDFPDGTFYFKVSENSVSAAYNKKEEIMDEPMQEEKLERE